MGGFTLHKTVGTVENLGKRNRKKQSQGVETLSDVVMKIDG